MRVKLQLVMCHDDGHEETITDVITLNKNNKRIEHLGSAIPAEPSSPVITASDALAFRKHQCENTP